jgi:Zn-dependent protease with chaperone function
VLFAISFGLEILGLDIGLSRLAAALLLSLPNSRKVETEADEIGLQLMSRACFDPSKAPSLW